MFIDLMRKWINSCVDGEVSTIRVSGWVNDKRQSSVLLHPLTRAVLT